jgi:hypothetical protein
MAFPFPEKTVNSRITAEDIPENELQYCTQKLPKNTLLKSLHRFVRLDFRVLPQDSGRSQEGTAGFRTPGFTSES